MGSVCDLFSASLISSLFLLCAATFLFGIGEFSNTHNTELALQLIGFILVLNSTIFAIITFIFKNRLLRNDLFKLLLTVLIYDLIAIIFMISGWNESRKAGYSFNWAFHFLFAGFILAILALVPIVIGIFYTKRILFNRYLK
jgi:hypothetical protein